MKNEIKQEPVMDLAMIEEKLIPWFQENARELPWRKPVWKEKQESKTVSESDGYRVWISEIMLQQTRVEAVKEYYRRFLLELPDVKALAEVPEDRLLKLWEGLGYYSRARNLKKAAFHIMEEYNGKMPQKFGELLKLPGIGSYTAGAVASIAFGEPVPAVDGNVLRVIMRLLGSHQDISQPRVKKELEDTLLTVMPKKDPGIYNQALMELGAMVCIPNGAPLCGKCPLAMFCTARKKEMTAEIPYKAPKKKRKIEEKTILVLSYQGKTALRKRKDKGLLAGLWEFPSLEGKWGIPGLMEYLKEKQIKTGKIFLTGETKHIFSHIEWRMTGYHIKIEEMPSELEGVFVWADRMEMEEKYALPSAFSFYQKQLFHNKDIKLT